MLMTSTSRVLAAVIIGLAFIGIAVPSGLTWDFANFYDAGHKARVGQLEDLYDSRALIEGQLAQSTMSFAGSPISAFLYAPISVLPPAVAIRVFKLAGTLAYALALLLLLQHCLAFVSEERKIWYVNAFLIACLLFQPIWTFYRVGGQTTPFVVLLLVVALMTYMRGRNYFCACCLVCVGLIKPGFGPLVLFIAVTAGLRLMLPLAVTALGAAVASLVIMGVRSHELFLQALAFHANNAVNWPYNSAITVVFDNLRVTPSVAPNEALLLALSMMVRAAVVIVFSIAVWNFHRRGIISDPARRHGKFLLAVSFGVLVVPVAFEHYLALLFIPLAYFLATFHGGGLILTMIVIVSAIPQNLILVSWLAARVQPLTVIGLVAIGIWKALPLYLTAALLLVYSRQLFESYLLPGWMANHQPEPAYGGVGSGYYRKRVGPFEPSKTS